MNSPTISDVERQAREALERLQFEREHNSFHRTATITDDTLDLVEEALSQKSEREEWQPIETAPKDGSMILAWCVHPHAEVVPDAEEYRCAVVTRWIDHNGGGWTWYGMSGRFTHWRPLPAPPAIRNLKIEVDDAG